jgi:hypothetical protein
MIVWRDKPWAAVMLVRSYGEYPDSGPNPASRGLLPERDHASLEASLGRRENGDERLEKSDERRGLYVRY